MYFLFIKYLLIVNFYLYFNYIWKISTKLMCIKLQAAWEDESRKNAQESPVKHFGSRNRKYGIKTALQSDLFEPTLNIGERGMPRTKRRASTTANNHSSSEMPQSNTEDAPRHPSKRLRHTSRLEIIKIYQIFFPIVLCVSTKAML